MNLASLVPESYRLLARLLLVSLLFIALYAAGRHHGAEQVRGEWATERAASVKAALAAEQLARQREQSMIQQLRKAEQDAQIREQDLRADADAAVASVGQLRRTVTDLRGQLSVATAGACRGIAETALDVFSQCAEEYRAVAAEADRFGSAAQTLNDAWPR